MSEIKMKNARKINMTLRLMVWTLIAAFSMSALPAPAHAGTIHTEGGAVNNATDGTQGNGSAWRLIHTSRPTEVVSAAVGAPTPGFWRADVGTSLVTQWQPGDDHLVVVDRENNTGLATHAGYYGVINKNITSSDPDQYSAMTLRPIPVPTATAGTNSITVTWTAAVADVGTPDRSATNISNYEVFRSTNAAGPFTSLGTVSSSTLTFTDSTVTAGTTFFYQIGLVYRIVTGTALKSQFISANSAAATASGGGGGAPTVTAVSPNTGSNASTTAITVTGTNFTGATGGTVGSTALTNLTVQSATSITATVPAGLTAGVNDVRITNASGTSPVNAPADQFTVTSGGGGGGGAPTVTAISPSSGPNSGTTPITITGTNLTGATAVTLGTTPLTFSAGSATQMTATVPAGLIPAVYDLTVTTPAGTSATSAASKFTVTAGSGGDASAPTTLAGTGESTSSVRWTWVDNSANETGFRVKDTTNVTKVTTPANAIATSEGGLGPNTTISRVVRAFNAAAESGPSNTASATSLANPPASVVTSGTTSSSSTVTMTPGTGGAGSFNVYRAPVTGGVVGPFARIATQVQSPFTDTGLAPSTTYVYQARANNTAGQENPTGTNSSQLTTQADSNPPTITNVKLDGLTPQTGDPASNKPLITATITDDVAIDPSTIQISYGGSTFTTTTTPAVSFTAGSGATSVQVVTPVPDGTTTLTITAKDTAGNPATFTLTGLKTQGGGGILINPPFNFKNPFDPNHETTSIVLDLTRAATVQILIFDSTARLVARIDRNLPAGHNEVVWNGRTDYGELASNGVYPMRVVIDGSMAGRNKIWVVKK